MPVPIVFTGARFTYCKKVRCVRLEFLNFDHHSADAIMDIADGCRQLLQGASFGVVVENSEENVARWVSDIEHKSSLCPG